MIARNEAARLAACLASARPAVDEIVVVDTGSTDGTQALARAEGAHVVPWAWRDDFAAARNQALAHARGPWILVLDADERLAPGAAELVRGLATAGDADGFNCRLVSRLPADQPSPVVTHWYCRLFRKRDGVSFEGRIHEQVAPSIVRTGGRIASSDVTILHEGYAEVSKAKLDRNRRLLEREMADRPDDAFVGFSLGMTLLSAGEWERAATAFERALGASRAPLAPHLKAIAWMKLAEIRMRGADWRGAGEAADRALSLEPGLALARYARGRALFEQGALDAAGRVFDELARADADALGMTLHPRIVAVARALVMLRQRKFVNAVDLLEPVADDDPTGEASFHVGNAYLGLGRLDEAADAYRRARRRGVKDPNLERRLALCARLTGAANPTGAGDGREA